jgi:hypothetical protein
MKRAKQIQARVDLVLAMYDHLVDNEETLRLADLLQHTTVQTVKTSHFIAKSSVSMG